jgi:hypothetical protein
MSDPATNNQNQSYVDSYAPPASPAPALNIDPQQTKPVSNDDALKKLEELVSEFETKKEEKKNEQLASIDDLKKKVDEVSHVKNPNAKQAVKKVDPLAELEKALDEYEKKYKDRVAETKNEPVKVEEKQEEAVSPAPTQEQPAIESNDSGENIEEQNIFDLLGVNDATDDEKESFLDELQQALWEDFLDRDLALLVSDEEMAEIEKIKADGSLDEDKKQTALINKIEEYVSDIEEIMMEKALELKEDMVLERVEGLRESLKQNGQDESRLNEAEEHLKQGHWQTGAQILNSL